MKIIKVRAKVSEKRYFSFF